VNAVLDSLGLFGNVFTFIDASTIISKTALWEERDRALRDGAEKLNNKNVENTRPTPMRGGEPNQRRTSGSATNATPPWTCATDS